MSGPTPTDESPLLATTTSTTTTTTAASAAVATTTAHDKPSSEGGSDSPSSPSMTSEATDWEANPFSLDTVGIPLSYFCSAFVSGLYDVPMK